MANEVNNNRGNNFPQNNGGQRPQVNNTKKSGADRIKGLMKPETTGGKIAKWTIIATLAGGIGYGCYKGGKKLYLSVKNKFAKKTEETPATEKPAEAPAQAADQK